MPKRRTVDINLPMDKAAGGSGVMDPRLLPYHPFEALKASKKKLYDDPMDQMTRIIEALRGLKK